jgi:hypothetical protein
VEQAFGDVSFYHDDIVWHIGPSYVHVIVINAYKLYLFIPEMSTEVENLYVL